MHISRSVAALVERLSHCAYRDAYRDGLKPAQWSALRYFSNANRFSQTTSAFARYQGITLGADRLRPGAESDALVPGERRGGLRKAIRIGKITQRGPLRRF